MKVDTKAFGEIEIDDKQKITIPKGLFGFEDYTRYAIFDAEHQPFFWLQSLDVKEIAFILINPFFFRKDYEINISNEEQGEIDLSSPENALIFVIVTILNDSPMTANLQGPIIINKQNMKGMQAILSDPKWRTKHDIMEEFKKSEKENRS
ncbi:MAG: flagellar assembly protein FliW [Treponema sp.]|nr:flagellar assembly protein FliW [Treponema sp.]